MISQNLSGAAIILALGYTPASSGAVTMSDGSAASPGMFFGSDTNTGFYRIAADTLGISAGGSNVASFTTNATSLTGTFTQTNTDTSTGSRPVQATMTLTAAPASAPVSTTHLHGFEIVHSTSGANLNSNHQMYPYEVTGQHSTNATIYAIRNILSNPISNGGGTVTEATAYWARGQTITGSTITRGYGYHVADWMLNGGTIGTLYGVYVDALTAGTTNYAIYTNTGTVRFGDTTRVDRTTTGIGLRASTYTTNEPANIPTSAAVVGTSYWNSSFGGHFTAQNSGTGLYAGNIGGSGISLNVGGSTSGATLFQVATDGGSGMSNAAVLAARIAPIINQTGTNSYTVLDLNPTEAATGSGSKYLINGRIGAGPSVFNVDTTGNILGGGGITVSPGASRTPGSNGQVTFELTNNTTLTFKAKGSDGTVRSGTVTLA